MRKMFHGRGLSTSYIENSSRASPLRARPSGGGALVLAQKCFNFSTLRGREGAPEPGAFQRCGGGGESERLSQFLLLGDGERKGAVEHVAGAQRIHGVNREGRRLLDRPVLVEPDGAPGPPRARQKRLGQLGDLVQRLGALGDSGGLPQRFAGAYQ